MAGGKEQTSTLPEIAAEATIRERRVVTREETQVGRSTGTADRGRFGTNRWEGVGRYPIDANEVNSASGLLGHPSGRNGRVDGFPDHAVCHSFHPGSPGSRDRRGGFDKIPWAFCDFLKFAKGLEWARTLGLVVP
jgi:hypothetical protein